MSLKLKYFTVGEAEQLLPRISDTLKSALETKIRIELKVEEWRRLQSSANEAENAVFQGQINYLASNLEKQLSEITELGAIPKDLDEGLIDFPARVEGKEGFLCWKVTESRITHWHGLTEGFQGRRPLKIKESKTSNEVKRSRNR